jgi:hypothetical protein
MRMSLFSMQSDIDSVPGRLGAGFSAFSVLSVLSVLSKP